MRTSKHGGCAGCFGTFVGILIARAIQLAAIGLAVDYALKHNPF